MKSKISFTLIAASLVFFLASGCKQDPVGYNNKIMEVVNASITDIDALNAEMEKEDLTNAENVRKAWETKLASSLDKLKGIGDFKGDSGFKNASIQTLETYLNIASKDYKRLIELRGLKDKADSNEINQILNRINQDFEKAGTSLNAASEKFAKEYTVQ
ncbi:ErpY-like lipoprotein [Leptospira weilii]|uniref:LIC11966 family lipoprotein n=1 Tax=Leptospira weilii TaxID=28184 RepID=UPI00256F5BFC|nr:ErpY-like lipoprotein [Leptospira weilii]MDL5244653.1 ErpY-like lipoprotein [Leptospira weilii]